LVGLAVLVLPVVPAGTVARGARATDGVPHLSFTHQRTEKQSEHWPNDGDGLIVPCCRG